MILAFNGNSGVGKDTLTQKIQDSRDAYHLKFAITLRAVYYSHLNLEIERIGDPDYEEYLKIKGSLVWFNSAYKVLAPDLCIHGLDWVLSNLSSPGKPVVISDLRQPNELRYLRRHGARISRLERIGNTQKPRALDNLLQGLDAHEITEASPQYFLDILDSMESEDITPCYHGSRFFMSLKALDADIPRVLQYMRVYVRKLNPQTEIQLYRTLEP